MRSKHLRPSRWRAGRRTIVLLALPFLARLCAVFGIFLSALPQTAEAIPVYARQTGQNCIASHAGGQFPELTAYGRLFKLTGYTTGSRTEVPLAMMAVASSTSVASKTPGTGDSNADFPQDGVLHFTTASVFA